MASAHVDQWRAFCSRLSRPPGSRWTGCSTMPTGAGSSLPGEAVDYGVADEVAAADARMYRLPGSPIGFGIR